MNLTEQQKKGQEVLFRIISEAWKNDQFKQALLANPKETLEQTFGKKFSSVKRIKVTDQSDPSYLYINIPVKPDADVKGPTQNQKGNKSAADSNGNGFVMTDYKTLYDSL
ncbi:hypothetical protein [Hymenobacter rigui]|uniref:NHLP leader peptide family natural product n=1 Tax=Hymenobacter rigui TaxID=334424 RepID=A0A428KMD0_9BACT|nr:hypothetical protein [Hymenobacter rigui]RSK47573.1 hypothetical protein EI291_15055 [Hymenobacter rigui]